MNNRAKRRIAPDLTIGDRELVVEYRRICGAFTSIFFRYKHRELRAGAFLKITLKSDVIPAMEPKTIVED